MKYKLSIFVCMILLMASCEQPVQLSTSGTHNGHDYVDLGLGVKWATCNVGANAPTEYGDYFAWGETETKKEFSYETYTFQQSPDELTRRYDAATANWGEGWRMPTQKEADELWSGCLSVRKKINGVAGLLITGPNGNSIFLPANGQKDDDDIEGAKTAGYYWTTEIGYWFDYEAYCIWFANYSDGVTAFSCSEYFRELGMGIRPVYDPED